MNFSIFSAVSHLRWSGLIEGTSYLLLLFIAMPLKYFAGKPAAVEIIGMAHGVLFIWYIISVVWTKISENLTQRQTFFSLLASLIPFGTYYADKKIFRKLEVKSNQNG